MGMMHFFPTKICKTCQITKSIWDYNQIGNGRYRAHCKVCWTLKRRNERSVIREQYTHQKAPNYTLEQLVKKFIHDPEFTLSYKRWRLHGFQKKHYPRITRIDKGKPYTLKNVMLRPYTPNP